jgi:hypothetical protein
MAKYESTISPRSTALATRPSSKVRATGAGVAALRATLSASLSAIDGRMVPHGVVFNGLDQIDQAIWRACRTGRSA